MSTFTMGAKTPYGRAQSLKSQIKKAEKTIVKGAIKYEKGKSKVDRKITKSLGFLEKGKFMKRDKSRKQIYNVGKSSRLNDRIGEPIFIRKREFVTNINGSTTFVNQSFPISMTNISLFPWVSSVAPSYEKYRVKNMKFHFKSTTSNYTSGGALGVVIMGVVYDPMDSIFGDQTTMLTYQGFRETRIDKDLIVKVNTKNDPLPVRYIVHNPNSAPFNDYGVFYIATNGNPITSIIGQLWVEYDVEFFIPRPNTVFNMQTYAYSYVCPSGTSVNTFFLSPSSNNSQGIPYTNPGPGGGTEILFNGPGYYMLTWSMYAGSNVTGTNINTTAYYGCAMYSPAAVYSIFQNNAQAVNGSGEGTINLVQFINCTDLYIQGVSGVTFPHTITTSASTTIGSSLQVMRTPNLAISTGIPILPEVTLMEKKFKELEDKFLKFCDQADIEVVENTNNNTTDSKVIDTNHRKFTQYFIDAAKVSSRSSSNK